MSCFNWTRELIPSLRHRDRRVACRARRRRDPEPRDSHRGSQGAWPVRQSLADSCAAALPDRRAAAASIIGIGGDVLRGDAATTPEPEKPRSFVGCGDHAIPTGLIVPLRQPKMARAMSKIAASEVIRVSVGQRFSFKKNINGAKNGANPERSTEPAIAVTRSASRGGVVMVSPCVLFGGLRRAHRASA